MNISSKENGFQHSLTTNMKGISWMKVKKTVYLMNKMPAEHGRK